jgi:DNA-binding NtrC family response regulator
MSNLAALEQITILRALWEADGNMSEAARLLGVNRPKLYRKVAAGSSTSDD